MIEEEIACWQERIRKAAAQRRTLRIQGSGSKAFCLPALQGEPLDVTGYRGIVDYDPTELVVTVRAGTPLLELQQTLAAEGQMLAFEPPAYADTATVGGTVACGLSGPRRPFAGALRDFMLGARCLNGRGEDLHFGGQVMKNVAGYDISRLLAGSRGSLGVILEVSFKVLPLPEAEATVTAELDADAAIATMNRLAGRPLPLSAAAQVDSQLYLRFSGSQAAVAAAVKQVGMDEWDGGEAFWADLREQRLAFFQTDQPLWRLSLPATAPIPDMDGEWLLDWGGALRWLRTAVAAATVYERTHAAGGYAGGYTGVDDEARRIRLPAPLLKLHQRLKVAFDPATVFNGGVECKPD